MPSNYPISPRDKLLRRFYEPLVLLSVLDPSRDAIKPDLITDRGLNEQAKLWRNFLDQSSFICDSEKGGDTVTSIAAQKTSEQPVFWLASNSGHCEKARRHLKWAYSCLERLINGDSKEAMIEKILFDGCVGFSSKRIKTYTQFLEKAFDDAKSQKKDFMTPQDNELFTKLEELIKQKSDHGALCSLAHAFRRDESMLDLSRRHNAQNQRNVWSEIRHQIGRLGTYTKAVKIMIRGAHRFPQLIENARIETIGPESKPNIPNPGYITDLQGIVHRLLSEKEADSSEALVTALTTQNQMAEIWESFQQRYSKIDPRPHAELLILEKFYRDELEFITDDRYIGCSKPSCYCCHLYMQFHPGRFSPRPCHGNLWIRWAPPIPLPSFLKNSTKEKGKEASRPQDHHTFKMLQLMLVPIRQDLQEQILSRRPRREKLPDSTTGISSILHLLQDEVVAIPDIATSSSTVESTQSSTSTPTSIEAGDEDESDNCSNVAVGSEDIRAYFVDTESTSRRRSMKVSDEEYIEDEDEDEDILVFKGRQHHSR